MIEFRNVSKSFDDQIILDNISFNINRGETKIILGGSGSGKSTILKLILGLIRPDSGQILIEGLDIARMTEHELQPIRRNIGMVFQEGALFDSLSVRENVGYRLSEEKRLDDDAIEEEVLQQLSFVGLEDSIDKMPAELSGGMKRRVGIARALVGTPKVVLYDEPTAGLDPITKRTIVELMVRLRDTEGVTSVFVTHDLQAASMMVNEYALKAEDGQIKFKSDGDSLCLLNNRFIMLQNGAICFEGSYQEMINSTLPYIRTFTS
jgi:phospholipid/cholesterol/gamma-HCH transport system ATP-binding protein